VVVVVVVVVVGAAGSDGKGAVAGMGRVGPDGDHLSKKNPNIGRRWLFRILASFPERRGVAAPEWRRINQKLCMASE